MQSWILLLGAGMVCGFLNAAASGGSAITLPLLLAFGFPPAVANGGSRLPVLVGMATAFWSFQRGGLIPWSFILLVLISGLSLHQASAVKVVLIGVATLISLAVFVVRGEVDWFASLPPMLGSAHVDLSAPAFGSFS